MPNFTPPTGYPYGDKDPLPHDDVNQIIEQNVKAPNADEGSSHAPTGDLEWSGANGFGFRFDTLSPFPFYGALDVTSQIKFTAAISGSVLFDRLVAIDILGPVTLKTGFAASLNVESGVTTTWLSGATCTIASGATCNLTGPTNVRGTMTFKSTANGGPGILAFEPDAQCYFATDCQVLASTDNWGWNSTSVQTHTAGSTVAGSYTQTATVAGSYTQSATLAQTGAATFSGGVTHTSKMTFSGASAYRKLRVTTGPDADTSINLWEADVWFAAPTTNRLWTLTAPPGNDPFTAFIVWNSGGGFSQSVTPVVGGSFSLNATGSKHGAVVVYDGSSYHAIVSSF